MRSVRFLPGAFEDVEEWLSTDRKLLQRILKLVRECQRTPFEGTGKPEPLKANLRGLWSRRITEEHRLVCAVTDNEIVVHSLKGHYE
ncbi:MAG: Txe/YoeB family addiction module toxin [Cytophagaceae bacterium]|nr:Txe/YoeB family addiction module toxin [Cytophagaceae bacterium]